MMRRRIRTALAASSLLLAVAVRAGTADSASEPLWEVGVATGAAWLPHYRGSDEHSLYTVPLPYVLYRGRIIEADREAVRGIFYRGLHLETDVSFAGQPPPRGRTRARDGMTGLPAFGEFGPVVQVFFDPDRPPYMPHLWITARAVFSAHHRDWNVRHEGYRAGVWLMLGQVRPARWPAWRFGASLGFEWMDRGLASRIYDVPDGAARADRPAYRADGGYAGASLVGHLGRTIGNRFSAGVYWRWDHVGGAAFADSPLVRTHNSVMLGASLLWTLAESERRVPARR